MDGAIADLRELLGPRLLESEQVRRQYARGEAFRSKATLPAAVARPCSTAEVCTILSVCSRQAVAVVPFGAGTSLEGQVQGPDGALCLDMTGMSSILAVNAGDMDVHVEAGVTRRQLEHHLRHTGLFFPVDPGADATLGGMAATRASGTTTVRYGAMRELTLGLTVVTPQGRVLETGGRARKSAAGYDLTALYLGSEGTLGVITELRLKLVGRPESTVAVVCQFPTLAAAVAMVTTALQSGAPLGRIELLDALQMRASIAFADIGRDWRELPTLFIELHGADAEVKAYLPALETLAAEGGSVGFRTAVEAEARACLWSARHNAYFAGLALAPGKGAYATDACVPIGQLPACVLEARSLADELGLLCPIVGHVGDGNFHMLVLHDPTDPVELGNAERLVEAVARLAIRHGGTCTGEHGIGRHKRHLLREQAGSALEIMVAVKAALDPAGIMNPGALFLP